MFGYSDIVVNFLTASPILAWLSFIVLVSLSFFLYRQTNPPLSISIRIGLGTLRLIAVIALIAALLEPVINYSRSYQRPRRISVLVDRSDSMDKQENGLTRRKRLDSLLSSDIYRRLQTESDIKTYYFSDRIDESFQDLDANRTALGDVLVDLSHLELGKPADNWLLFSDGRSNTGQEPREAAKGLSVPVSSLFMAVDKGSFDIAITEVEFNPMLFVGQSSEIKVKLSWHEANGKTPVIRLLDGKKIRSEQRYEISQDDGFGELVIKYLPERPGQKLLTLKFPELTGEETTGNNQRSIAVTVLKSKLSILVLSERPDYEIGFLQRYLRESDKYDLNLVLTGKKGGNFSGTKPLRQTELNRYDLIILHDPDPRKLAGQQKLLESYLNDKGGAIWVLMGEQFAAAGPVPWFNNLLPFSQSVRLPILYREFRGIPSEGNLFHPAVRLGDDRASIRAVWALLPPFQSLVRCNSIAAGAVILANADENYGSKEQIPVLGFKRIGAGKVIVTSALPLWSWGFVNRGFGEDDRFYRLFLEGIISWATIPEEFDPIRITPEKQVFSRGETVRFQGFAFDQGFRAMTGVSGVVTLTDEEKSEKFESDLIESGEGKFVSEFRSLPPGRYGFVGKFEKGGVTLKRQSGRIIVEPYSLEDIDRSGDPGSMMAISRLSGGNFYSIDEFDNAIAAISLNLISETEKVEIGLFGRFWLLMIFLAALSLEWLVRKVYQLI